MEKNKLIVGALLGFILMASVLLFERSARVNRDGSGIHDTSDHEAAGQILPNELALTSFPNKKNIGFDNFKGKVLLINFWASWCEACMAEMPSIQKLYSSLKSEGLEVLAINVDDNPEKVIPDIVRRLNLNFPIFTDTSGELSKFFDVVAIPFSVVVDREQKIVWVESGERDWSSDEVLANIKKLLN